MADGDLLSHMMLKTKCSVMYQILNFFLPVRNIMNKSLMHILQLSIKYNSAIV